MLGGNFVLVSAYQDLYIYHYIRKLSILLTKPIFLQAKFIFILLKNQFKSDLISFYLMPIDMFICSRKIYWAWTSSITWVLGGLHSGGVLHLGGSLFKWIEWPTFGGLTFEGLIFGEKDYYIRDFTVFHKQFLFWVLKILDLLYFIIIIFNAIMPS